jgi:acyl-CoA dehydrogenase
VRRDVWPSVISGEKLLCFALSERETGPTSALRTQAVPIPGGFRIGGTKRWVSRGAYADFALVYAVAEVLPALEPSGDPPSETGPTAFLVPLGEPGVRILGPTRILGRAGGEEVTIEFDGVVVPSDHVVGELHAGDAVARSGALTTSVFTAGRFIGLSRWALERAAAVVDRGEQAMDAVEAGRLLADGVNELRKMDFLARRGARAATADGRTSALRLVQLLAPSMCGRAYEAAMRIGGADALTNDARLFDGWHQAMIVKVAQARIEPIARDLEERLRRHRRPSAGRA